MGPSPRGYPASEGRASCPGLPPRVETAGHHEQQTADTEGYPHLFGPGGSKLEGNVLLGRNNHHQGRRSPVRAVRSFRLPVGEVADLDPLGYAYGRRPERDRMVVDNDVADHTTAVDRSGPKSIEVFADPGPIVGTVFDQPLIELSIPVVP